MNTRSEAPAFDMGRLRAQPRLLGPIHALLERLAADFSGEESSCTPSEPRCLARLNDAAHEVARGHTQGISPALASPESRAGELLEYLCKIHCLSAPVGHQAGYRYAPRDEEMRALLGHVVHAYRTEMIGMMLCGLILEVAE